MNADILERLKALAARDGEVRSRLAANGSLFHAYHPEIEGVHVEHAVRLAAIVKKHGWPGISLVGEEGCAAAFTIAQHAIGRPDLQRKFLQALEGAAVISEAPPRHVASLGDRVRYNEGRPQLFGVILDWDENGEWGPGPIEDPERVDERRRSVGLAPLAETVRRTLESALAEGEVPPADPRARKREEDEWFRRVGWR